MITPGRILVLALLWLTGQATAADKLVLAGADSGGETAYTFAGLLVPFPGSDLGHGFFLRYWVDWLRYEYESGDRTITARAPGASVAVGYSQSGPETGAWSVSLGAVWRDTDLTPADPGSSVEGSHWGLNISLQGSHRLGAAGWQLGGIASFNTTTDTYWVRGRLLRRLASGRTLGVEAIAHGNDEYAERQAGLVLADIAVAPRTTLGLKGGARKSRGGETGVYAGIEFARAF